MYRIILLLFISISAQSQIPFSINPNLSEAFGTATDIFFNADAVIFNNSDSTITFEWERISETIPNEWETSVCTNSTCLPPEVTNGEFSIDSGYAMDLNCTFYPNDFAGNGEVEVKVWIKNGSTQSITQTYNGYADPVNILESNPQPNISISPNPVHHSFELSQSINFKEIEIYNLQGQLVQTFSNQSTYNIQHLTSNLYFITVLSEQNEVLTILKLIKL